MGGSGLPLENFGENTYVHEEGTTLTIASRITEPQVFPDEAEARQGAEAEPPHPAMDSSANQQRH